MYISNFSVNLNLFAVSIIKHSTFPCDFHSYANKNKSDKPNPLRALLLILHTVSLQCVFYTCKCNMSRKFSHFTSSTLWIFRKPRERKFILRQTHNKILKLLVLKYSPFIIVILRYANLRYHLMNQFTPTQFYPTQNCF